MNLTDISEYWEAITGSGIVATTLGYFGVSTVKRIDKLEHGKADRDELTRAMQLIEKNNDEARQSRRELHQKLDKTIETQTQFNIEMAKYMGRINGKH